MCVSLQCVFSYESLNCMSLKIFCCKHHTHKVSLQYVFSYERLKCLSVKRHVLKPETTGTEPPEQPERPEQESEMTGTTETKMEHDRNKVVEHDRNDSYLIGLIQTVHLN